MSTKKQEKHQSCKAMLKTEAAMKGCTVDELTGKDDEQQEEWQVLLHDILNAHGMEKQTEFYIGRRKSDKSNYSTKKRAPKMPVMSVSQAKVKAEN